MNEIPASDLRAGDIGSRVTVIDESGNAYTGTLTDVGAREWQYGKRPEDMVRIGLSVSSEERSELKLSSLPLDFRLQIEREGNET